MAIVERRKKILFLPVVRGLYPFELTQSAKAAMREAAGALGIEGIFPADDRYSKGVIHGDEDVRAYWEVWKHDLHDIKALIAFSGDFMSERAIQDTARLLPPDVPVFLMVNNDVPGDMTDGKVGDSLCGSLSVHHNLRMLGRRVARSCRIDMHDRECLKGFLRQYQRIIDGIECLRNMRIAMLGVNPSEFATTFTNQIKLFELGFSLHTYELIAMWGDTMLAALADDNAPSYTGPFGVAKFWRPIRKSDPRVEEAKALLAAAIPALPGPEKVEAIARCFVWIKDTFDRDGIDAGGIHCWSEFSRFFGIFPCAFAMLANHALRRPLVCEADVCHAIMAKLAWAMTGEAGVILDINNSGWDPRVFNVFHCSETPPNWLVQPTRVMDNGRVEGHVAPAPFTAISAATTGDSFHAIVFQGRMLPQKPAMRGSSGWAFVPNLPEVMKAIEGAGIHHYVALKGHLGGEAADALRFRGLIVENLSQEVPAPDAIDAEFAQAGTSMASRCRVFSE